MGKREQKRLQDRGHRRRPHGAVPHPGLRRAVGRGADRHRGRRRGKGGASGRPVRHAGLHRLPGAVRQGGRGVHRGAHAAPLRDRQGVPRGGDQRPGGEAPHLHARARPGSLPHRARPERRPARRSRGAVQRRRPGAAQDRREPHPGRVPPAGPVRSPRAARHGGHGPHDPRRRHRAGAGGQRGAPDHRGGRAGALHPLGRRQRADPVRERDGGQHHGQPGDRAQGPHARDHPA